MANIIDCPSCQRRLRVPDELLGTNVKCPSCGTMFTTAASQPAPPPPAAPQSYAEAPPKAPPRERVAAPPRNEFDFGGADPGYPYDPSLDRARLQPHRGTMILVFGILSLVACSIFGPIAWVMGSNDLAEMRAGRMDPEGRSTTEAGRICGMIASILLIIGLVFMCGLFLLVGIGANAR
jgi:predicted Zn finger-like uncharacterized protein